MRVKHRINTAAFRTVATTLIFHHMTLIQTFQNVFRLCNSIFVQKTTEISRRKLES